MSEVSQSLERGLLVLETIDSSPEPLGGRELARQLGLSAAIVQRLITTLLAGGYIEQVAETRRYKIGYRSVALGMSSLRGDTMRVTSQACLTSLAQEHGLNGYLAVLMGDNAVYVLAVPSRHRVILRIDVGETLTLHSTALGRVLLAAAGDRRARELLGPGPLKQITPKTVLDPDEVIRQLADIRRLGYASVSEENISGFVSVGAPVRNSTGKVVAGISVAYAMSTVALSFDEVIEVTVDAAAKISRGMGCPDSLLHNWDDAA